jgi:hypothetical protein
MIARLQVARRDQDFARLHRRRKNRGSDLRRATAEKTACEKSSSSCGDSSHAEDEKTLRIHETRLLVPGSEHTTL